MEERKRQANRWKLFRKYLPWCWETWPSLFTPWWPCLDDVDNTVIVINTVRPKLNRRRFPDDIFKCFVFKRNVRICIQINEICLRGPIVSIGSDHGKASNRLQTIIWINVDQNIWHHMLSLGHNEVTDAVSPVISYYCEPWVETLTPRHWQGQCLLFVHRTFKTNLK